MASIATPAASGTLAQNAGAAGVPDMTSNGTSDNSIPVNVAGIVILSGVILVALDVLRFRFVIGANVG